MIYKAMRKLDLFTCGGDVSQDVVIGMVQPSIYSKLLCRNLGQHLRMQLKHDPLLSVGCYRNPLFRGLEFVPNRIARRNLRMKAEEMTHKLARSQFACALHTDVQYQPQSFDVDGLAPTSQYIRIGNGPNPNPLHLCISGRNREFALLDFADSEPSSQFDLDEISIYNEVNSGAIKEKKETFLLDEFSIIKFWYNRKRQHTAMY